MPSSGFLILPVLSPAQVEEQKKRTRHWSLSILHAGEDTKARRLQAAVKSRECQSIGRVLAKALGSQSKAQRPSMQPTSLLERCSRHSRASAQAAGTIDTAEAGIVVRAAAAAAAAVAAVAAAKEALERYTTAWLAAQRFV